MTASGKTSRNDGGPLERAKARYAVLRRIAESRSFAVRSNNYSILTMNTLFKDACRPYGAAEIRGLWLKSIREQAAAGLKPSLKLFIGTPYCKQRCDYCRKFKATLNDSGDLEAYKDRLCAAADYYADIFEQVEFSAVYFGGGTPSLFTPGQLEEICARIVGKLRIAPRAEVNVECSPHSTTLRKLKILRKHGFWRVSFGCQSCEARVLQRIGRGYQTNKMVENCVAWAKKAGFGAVNVDLIAGLAGDDGNAFLKSLAFVRSLKPDNITVYELEPTPHYLGLHHAGKLAGFEKDLGIQKTNICSALGRPAAHAARHITNLLPNNDLNRRKAPDYTFEKYNAPNAILQNSLFALGSYFCSDISVPEGKYVVHAQALENDPAANKYTGVFESVKEELRVYVINQLAWGNAVDKKVLDEYKRARGLDFYSEFREPLSMLAALGLLKVTGGSVGPLLGKDRAQNYTAAMFFFDYPELLKSSLDLLRRA